MSHGERRILIAIGTLARIGGAERQAMYFVEHASRIPGWSVEVLTFEDGHAIRGQIERLKIPIHAVPYNNRWSRTRRLRALTPLVARLRLQMKPDAIIPFGSQASKAAGLISPGAGARFVWWNQQDEGRGLGGTRAERRILARASRVTSNSVAGRDFLAERFGLDPASILVYNNGTPVPEPRPGGAWEARLESGDRPIVAMIANITRYKDHETLISAWAAIRDRFPPARRPILALAGSTRRSAFVSSLKTRAFDLGLSADDIRFPGAIGDVHELLRDCTLVVHSSLTEGCPNAVCEAMAAGRAVVATDIPGCRQALGNDSERWLVPQKDPGALANAIITLLEDQRLREEAGAANRDRIRSEFSIEGMNQLFVREIEAGLERGSAG